jgi:hypothetical protein
VVLVISANQVLFDNFYSAREMKSTFNGEIVEIVKSEVDDGQASKQAQVILGAIVTISEMT